MAKQEWFNLKEAAALTGIKFKTLQTWAERGKIPVSIRLNGGKKQRVVSWETLNDLRAGNQGEEYEKLFAQYLAELKAGVISKKPCSAKHLEATEYAMGRYWHHIDKPKSIAWVGVEGFRYVMQSIGFDDAKKRDYYGTRIHIYKALTGFMRLLVRDGYKTADELAALKELKPGRKFTYQSPEYPTADEVRGIIRFNLNRLKGRREADAHLMNALLHLYAYTGIRRMEASDLTLKDVDLDELSLRVWGKGGKRRKIPMPEALQPVLKEWIEWRGDLGKDDPGWLLLNQDGEKLTDRAIQSRFQRLSKVWGKRVTPHGLRHACATILAQEGMPVVLIQRMLGHSDISTTNLYLNPTDKDLFEWVHKRKGEAGPVVPDERLLLPLIF